MSIALLYNENELLALIAQSDELAFAKVVTHYKDKVFSIAYKLTKSTVIAEEIVHDVFLKIWNKRATLSEIHNFQAYLLIVTRNDVYKVLKKIAQNYKVVLLSDENQLSSILDTSDLLMEKEYKLLLQNAVDRLPNQQKVVYSLLRDQGLKRDEVALKLNIKPETVKFHMVRAMKSIRSFCMLHLGSLIGFSVFLLGCSKLINNYF